MDVRAEKIQVRDTDQTSLQYTLSPGSGFLKDEMNPKRFKVHRPYRDV